MEIEPAHLIDAYREELRAAHESRVLLLAGLNQQAAVIKQLTDERMAAQLAQAQADDAAADNDNDSEDAGRP